MLLRVIVAAACVAVVGCKKPKPLFERIYALDEIPTFTITLSPEAVAVLAERPREYVTGSFSYKDETFDEVGIRIKGHRSLRKLGDKSSFKIKLDRYDKKADLAKQKTLTLNNMFEDPSMMREVLAYRLYRALGVAAPNAGFAEVVVNGEPQGLYAVIETVDKRFLKARFDDAKGPVYEGEWGCDVLPEDVAGFDQDGGPKDRVALARFAKAAAGDAATLFGPDSPLDVPAFLRFLAVEMYVANFDGYRHGHNYRLYFEPTKHKWYFIPWGLDRTFVRNMSIYDSHGHLAQRCFADAACRLAYARTMRDVVAEARRLRLENGVDVIAAVTRDAVLRDRRRKGDAERRRRELKGFLVERPAEVERQIACLDAAGNEVDADHDGYGCGDCDDRDPAIHPGAEERCDGVDTNCNGLVDDAPSCACTPVDAGTAKLSLCPLAMSYDQAKAFCAARGEALARIDDAAQQAILTEALATQKLPGDRRWWIGLDDRADENHFQWLAAPPAAGKTIESSSFTNWGRHEPDNAGCNQDCATIDASDGKWADFHCNDHRPFVCRAP